MRDPREMMGSRNQTPPRDILRRVYKSGRPIQGVHASADRDTTYEEVIHSRSGSGIELAIHPDEYDLLLHFWREEGMTRKQLAEHFCVSVSTLDTVLKRAIDAETLALHEQRTDEEKESR